MDFSIHRFEKHSDERGHLVVFLQNSHIKKEDKEFGQIYFITFESKDTVRGNHYHKNWREWFGIVTGKLRVVLKDVNTGEMVDFIVEAQSDDYVRIETGPYIAHSFQSLSDHAALLNYANGEWNDKDTFPYVLIKKGERKADEKNPRRRSRRNPIK